MFTIFKSATIVVLLSSALGACAETKTHPIQTGTITKPQNVAYTTAIHHYEAILAQKPNEIEAVLGLARNLRWAGLSQDAERVLQTYKETFGADGRYLAELGKIHLIQGRSDLGVKYIRQATRKNTDDWRLYSALGIGLDYQEQYEQAEAAYKKALQMCPDDPAVMNNLGISQGLSGHLDQGIITLRQALRYGQHTDKIKQNLTLFTDARDLCATCGATYIKASNGMILAANLKNTDQNGPCSPHPQYTQNTPIMVTKLAPQAKVPSLNMKVYFEFDSAILKPEAKDVLNNLGQALTFGVLNNYRFEIAGHTDAMGSDTYNQKLSERRAKAVQTYLSKHFSIDPKRIDWVGYGESRLLDPENPNSDINRRVQVTRLDRMVN